MKNKKTYFLWFLNDVIRKKYLNMSNNILEFL